MDNEQLLKGNSLLSGGKLIAQLIGLSVAGIIISHWGLIVAVTIDAITFFISFLLIINMNISREEKNKEFIKISDIVVDLRSTITILISEWSILKTTVIATFVNFFIGPFNLLILQYCKDVLSNGSQGQSVLNTINVLGVLLISCIFIKLANRITCSKLINIGFWLLSISFLLFGVNKWMSGAMFITLIYGLGTGLISIPSVTLIQQETPKEHLGKVLSIISLINESSVPFGNLIAGLLIERINIKIIFLLFGFSMLLMILLITLVFNSFYKLRNE